jgi:DNA-directed RNA polymerase specialized sigma24 family protein
LSLDEMAAAARDDAGAESRLCAILRERFLQVAKHRVREADAEDVVQDALRIVFQKYRDRAAGAGILVWSFAVLRHVVGNYYQAQRRHARLVPLDGGAGEDGPGGRGAGESLEAVMSARTEPIRLAERGEGQEQPIGVPGESDLCRRLDSALAALERTHPRCAMIFRAILASHEQGGGPREVSQRALRAVQGELPGLKTNGFYVALHRCRARLREALERP